MLADLLDRNARHAASLPTDHFDGVRDGQSPALVTVCCSDSRVPAEGMWSAREPGWAFTVEVIGNQTCTHVDGRRVVAGSVMYPLAVLGTRHVAVVGHTGCGAVSAAFEAAEHGRWPDAPGVRQRIEPLVEAISARLDDEMRRGREALELRLVEHNVHDQVAFLLQCGEVPDGTRVFGFVYDLHGAYGGPPGRAVLVNVDGERDVDVLAKLVPTEHRDAIGSLL